MSVTDFDWSTFIAEMTEVPTDVVFHVVEDGEIHEMKAHKVVVGMISIAFKTMFFTTDVGDKNIKEIKVEATTKQAFQIIIDDLYKIKSIKDSLEGKSLQEIFDVVNLIERYQMAKLQDAMNGVLSNYPVTDDTVLEVAEEAIHQSRLFQKEAHLVLITCAKFLKPKLKDADTIFKYVEENEDKKEVVAALLARMNAISIASTECSNCGYEDCEDGKEINAGEFREGLLVTNNPADLEWGDVHMGTGKVTRVGAEGVDIDIEHVKSGVTQNGVIGDQFNGGWYDTTSAEGSVKCFLFACN